MQKTHTVGVFHPVTLSIHNDSKNAKCGYLLLKDGEDMGPEEIGGLNDSGRSFLVLCLYVFRAARNRTQGSNVWWVVEGTWSAQREGIVADEWMTEGSDSIIVSRPYPMLVQETLPIKFPFIILQRPQNLAAQQHTLNYMALARLQFQFPGADSYTMTFYCVSVGRE